MVIIKEKSESINVDMDKVVDKIQKYISGDINIYRDDVEIKEDSFYMKLNIKKSLASHGEIMEIKGKKDSESKTTLDILSKCVEKKTIVDWGKNSRNIKGVLGLFRPAHSQTYKDKLKSKTE